MLLATALALSAVAHLSVRAFRLRAQALTATTLRATSPGIEVLSTSGVDIWGTFGAPKILDSEDDTVVFVLRSSTYAADVDLWNSVSRMLEGKRRLRFLAFCSDHACVASARQTSPQDFPVLAFGQVVALERLCRADKLGVALIINHVGRIKGAVRWRGAPAASTAARLLGDHNEG